jgi:hypothetical protein
MLVACRLANLSALEGHYAGLTLSQQAHAATEIAARLCFNLNKPGARLLPRIEPN